MARERSDNRKKAFKLWNDSGRTLKPAEIGAKLGVSAAMVRVWKHYDDWESMPERRPRGGQPGNQNAAGNSGGGAPTGNDNAVKHGLYRKYLPDDPEFQELLDMANELDPVEMLWQGVVVAYSKMMRAQKTMFVTGKEDMTKEVRKIKEASGKNMESLETEWEIQFAWDKQATDIRAYAMIAKELRSAIKQFLDVVPENDERRAKLAMMQVQEEKTRLVVQKLNKDFAPPEDGSQLQKLSDEELQTRIGDELAKIEQLKKKMG